MTTPSLRMPAEQLSAAFTECHKATKLPWLQQYRASAFAQFQASGFPTRKDEHWKYTDTSTITQSDFVIADAGSPASHQAVPEQSRYQNIDCHELVFINGHYSAERSRVGQLPSGVTLGNFKQWLKTNPGLLESNLNQCVDLKQHVFASLNTAFFTDGGCIYLPDHTVLEKPIILFFASLAPEITQPRNLIILGKHAKATIIEHYMGTEGKASFTNAVTEIITHDGAALDYYKVQQEHSFHISGTHANQYRDSRIESYAVTVGGALVRNDTTINLLAEGAAVTMHGLYLGNDRQHIDNHTLINHAKPHTYSAENYRGVLDDHARGVFNGKVMVHKDAQKIEAAQSNANLLLSDNAEIDTKPELEIYANDVKCSHGATVGQLDKNALFYLRARGLDQVTAQNILIYAFAEDVISRIKFMPIRKQLEHIMVGRLSGA